MKSTEFLLNILKKTLDQFPTLTFGYHFDSIMAQHIIRVSPDSIFESDDFAQVQSEIIADFLLSHPNESLMFISVNDGDETLPESSVLLGHANPKTSYPIETAVISVKLIEADLPFRYPDIPLSSENLWFQNKPTLLDATVIINYYAEQAGENNYAMAA
ncbi:MAG: hypothetical protein WDO14_14725 [Bacteroidota bacterium]